MLVKLALTNFRVHKVRFALTATAVALSVSLVVAVTSGYTTAEGAAKYFLNKYLGATDAQVTRQGHTPMPQTIADDLRHDPDIAKAVGRLENESLLMTAQGAPLVGRDAQIVGITRPDDTRVDTLQLVSGNWFTGDSGNVAVIDQVAAEMLNIKVGGEFALPSSLGPVKFRLVGIVHKPGILAAHIQTVYIPIRTLQQISMPGQPPQLTRVLLEFKPDRNADAIAARWQPKFTAADPLLKLKLTRENRKDLDKNLSGFHALSYLGGAVSMLAAAFIVFSALSMGVAERQRTLAMLRAIGMERRRVGQLVIYRRRHTGHSRRAAIGVPLGWFWVKILVSLPMFREVLVSGVVLSWGGMAMGVFGSMLSALLASLLPAYGAMRVSPLEAMSPLASPPRSRVPWKAAAAGLALICIDTFLMFGPVQWLIPSQTYSRAARFYLHFGLGVPGLMIGFFLLAPVFVRTVERVLGSIVAPDDGIAHRAIAATTVIGRLALSRHGIRADGRPGDSCRDERARQFSAQRLEAARQIPRHVHHRAGPLAAR